MDEIGAILVGIILGWLGAFLHQTYYSMREQDISLINDFIADIMELEEVAVSYWLADDEDEGLDSLADSIRGRYHAIGCFSEDAARLLSSDYEKFKELDGMLFDLAMGSDFQTKHRMRNPAIAVEIMQRTRELRALFRRSRRKRYWSR